MRGKSAIVISGAVIAVGLAGHGALEALADQKVEEAFDRLRAQLPAGSTLTYSAIDGDPYTTGAVIQQLALSHPTWGHGTIERLRIEGVRLDDAGNLSAIGELQTSDVVIASTRSGELRVADLQVADLSGEGLARLLANDHSLEALAALEFSKLAANDITASAEDAVATIEGLDVAVDAERHMDLEVARIALTVPSEEARLDIATLGWSGGLPPAGEALPALDQPELVFKLLPSTFTLVDVDMSAPEGTLSLAGLKSVMQRSGETAITSAYTLDELAVSGSELPAELGNSLSVQGNTLHDLTSGITQASLQIAGDRLANADIALELRGVDLLTGMFAGQPTPADPQKAPAIIAIDIDYRDQGIADHLLDAMIGSTPQERDAAAEQLLFVARAMVGGEIPASFDAVIAETKQFLIDPQRLQIKLAPNAPVDIANLTLAALMNPGGLPELLGLSVLAND